MELTTQGSLRALSSATSRRFAPDGKAWPLMYSIWRSFHAKRLSVTLNGGLYSRHSPFSPASIDWDKDRVAKFALD